MNIHIEKYADGVKQETLTLPLGPLRFSPVCYRPRRADTFRSMASTSTDCLIPNRPLPTCNGSRLRKKTRPSASAFRAEDDCTNRPMPQWKTRRGWNWPNSTEPVATTLPLKLTQHSSS